MPRRTVVHVVPAREGWRLKGGASSEHDTNVEAVDPAKRVAKAAPLVVIHTKDVKVQTAHTYGKDPRDIPG